MPMAQARVFGANMSAMLPPGVASGGDPQKLGKESQYEKFRDIRGEYSGHLQDNEDEQGNHVWRVAPNMRDFGQWGEKHGSDAVAKGEQGHPKRGDSDTRAKLLCEVINSWTIDTRPNVYGEGQETEVEDDEALLRYRPVEWVCRIVRPVPCNQIGIVVVPVERLGSRDVVEASLSRPSHYL